MIGTTKSLTTTNVVALSHYPTYNGRAHTTEILR